MNLNQIWQTVLGEVELQISRPNFLTWFKQSQLVAKDEKDGAALVGLPNNFAKEWVKNRYHKIILGSLRNLDGSIKSVNYVVISQGQLVSLGLPGKKPKKLERETQPQPTLIETKIDPRTNLNPKYNLESFVVGSSNEMAYAAIQAVIKDIGKKYNPLLILSFPFFILFFSFPRL